MSAFAIWKPDPALAWPQIIFLDRNGLRMTDIEARPCVSVVHAKRHPTHESHPWVVPAG